MFVGDFGGYIKMGLINFGNTVIYQFLVQLFLFLETEHLSRLFAKHAGNFIERNIVVIGVIGGDHVDLNAHPAANIQPRHQGTIGLFRSVDGDNYGA